MRIILARGENYKFFLSDKLFGTGVVRRKATLRGSTPPYQTTFL